MGNCQGAGDATSLVPTVQNSFTHLIMLNQTELIKQKIQLQKHEINTPINFRGDTLLHYACAKQNFDLIDYLLSKKQIKVCQKNIMGQMPKDKTKNTTIRRRCE